MNEKKEKVYTNNDKTVFLEISDDNCSAYLTIKDPKYFVDEKDISELLISTGIKYGIEKATEHNIKNEIKKEVNKPFLIAMGTKSKAQSRISYLFEPEKCFNPNEQVDVFEMEKFYSIHKDQPLANLLVGSDRLPGMDIFGNEISDDEEVIINNIDEFVGENVYYSEKDSQIRASKSGYPYIDTLSKINIKSDFVISSDIKGKDLNLTGDVVVDGVINNSKIKISGNLIAKSNISECLNSGIYVSGDVEIEFAEDAKIVSGGTLKFNKSVRACIIRADNGVIGKDNSSITGGLIQSRKNIDLYSVGSPFATLTEVDITTSPYLKEQIKLLQSELLFARNNSKENEEKIQKLSTSLTELESRYENELDEYSSKKIEDVSITVRDKIFPVTSFRIFKFSRKISKETGRVTFSIKNDTFETNKIKLSEEVPDEIETIDDELNEVDKI